MVEDVHGGGAKRGGGHVWQGEPYMEGGGMHGGGVCDMGACMAGKTATAADGTHPTGMHSCFIICTGYRNLSS